MADYTLHLGYNLDSPTIGSVWMDQSSEHRFLQYALAASKDEPAWFQFQQDDRLFIRLWDLSSWSDATPSAWLLKLGLSSLAAPATTYNPSSYMTYPRIASVQGSPNSYLQIGTWDVTYTTSTDPYQSPWGSCRGRSAPFEPLQFTTAQLQCKLSFWLQASISGAPSVFLSDPEVIVGSRV